MVASGLMVLVVYCAYVLLVAAAGYQQQLTASLEVQQETMKALVSVARELSEGRAGAVAVSASPDGFVYVSPRDMTGGFAFSPDGELLWGKFVCFYRDPATDTLVRKEEALPPGQVVPPPITVDTAYFAAATGLETRIVARDIASFTVTAGNPVELRLTSRKSVRDEDYGVEAVTKVGLRN